MDIVRGTSRALDIAQLAAVVLLALILIPSGAHLFEMGNKLALAPSDYMTAQRSYDGWAWFGVPIFAAILATALNAWLLRGNPRAAQYAAGACVMIVATQVIFWTRIFPINELTVNWTAMPADLAAARHQWEYGHAVNALITFAALVSMVLSVFASRPAVAGTR